MHITLFLLSLILVKVCTDICSAEKNSRNFTGKVVLVTGSTSGMGEVAVKLFSSLSARVVVTGRNQTNIKRVTEEVTKLSPQGLRPLEVIVNLEDEKSVKRLFDLTINKFGTLDILVNNAAVYIFPQDIRNGSILKMFDSTMAQNVRALLQLIHLSIPYLEKSKGTIINVSSIAGIISSPSNVITYSMSKAAIETMVKVLAVELGPSGIRVNNIAPGFTNTPMITRQGISLNLSNNIFAKMIPLQRIGESIDIAKAMVFLASNDSNFITGVTLLVDGGFHFNLQSKVYS